MRESIKRAPFPEMERVVHGCSTRIWCCWPWRVRTPTEVSLSSAPGAQLCILMDGVAGARPSAVRFFVAGFPDLLMGFQDLRHGVTQLMSNPTGASRSRPACRPAQCCTVLGKNYSDFFLLLLWRCSRVKLPIHRRQRGGRGRGRRTRRVIPPLHRHPPPRPRPRSDHATTL